MINYLVKKYLGTLCCLYLCTLAFGQSQDPAGEWMERAGKAQESEFRDSALYFYEKARAYYRENDLWEKYIEASAGVSRNYLRMDKYPQAEETALSTIALHDEKQLSKADPDYLEILIQMGRINWWIKGNFPESFRYLYLAKSQEETLTESAETRRSLYTDLGYAHGYAGNLDSCVYYFESALDMSLDMYGKGSAQTADRYTDLGMAYTQKSDWDKAEEAQRKAIELNVATRGEDHIATLKCYNNLGYIYLEKYDNDLAIFYLNKAIDLIKKKFGPSHRSVGIAYMNIGAAYSNKGDYKNAVKYSKMALENYKVSIGSESPFAAIVLVNLGSGYTKLNQPDSALRYFEKGLALNEKLYGKEHPELVSYYAYINDFYLTFGMYKEAEEGILTSIELAEKVMPSKHLFTGRNYFHLAQVMQATGRTSEALRQCQIALTRIMQDFEDLSPDQNPDVSGPSVSRRKLIEILALKTKLLYTRWLETSDIHYLESGHRAARATSRSIDILRTEYQTPESKEILLTRTREFFEDALRIALALYESGGDPAYLANAFMIMEKSKSVLLFERIQTRQEYLASALPDTLAREERRLARSLSQIEQQRFDLQASGDTTGIAAMNTRYFQAKRSHDFLLSKIEEQYPQYFEIRHQALTASLTETQLALDEGTLMINYFLGDSTLYALGITRDSVWPVMTQTDVSGGIEQILQQIRNKSFDPATSHKAYQAILEPVLTKSGPEVTTLMIVPDQILHYLPFEVLITASGDPGSYLLKKYIVTYAHSASLPGEGNKKTDFTGPYIGFSPEYQKQGNPLLASRSARDNELASELVDLPMAKEEIRQSAGIWNGEFLTGPDATESAFKTRARQAGIIHIASHAIIDDEEPMRSRLVFSVSPDSTEDGLLHTYELYNMELRAQLACLSACNTGFGQLKSGEGVVSLAKGFFYAGVPNIMMSLWSVPDNSTSQIMQLFNAELEQGAGKAEALRRAKLRFLEQADAYTAEPYYWAAFTLIGDNEPLHTGESNLLYVVGIGILVLGGVFGLVLYRKKNTTG